MDARPANASASAVDVGDGDSVNSHDRDSDDNALPFRQFSQFVTHTDDDIADDDEIADDQVADDHDDISDDDVDVSDNNDDGNDKDDDAAMSEDPIDRQLVMIYRTNWSNVRFFDSPLQREWEKHSCVQRVMFV